MKLHTASEVISLVRTFENETAEFYDQLCRFGKHEEDLRVFARENRRNVVQVQLAYNNVISDALEGGFAFDIDAEEFGLEIPQASSFPQAFEGVVRMETTLARLYSTAAAQSESLLPDVSCAMKTIARKRQARIEKLRSLLDA